MHILLRMVAVFLVALIATAAWAQSSAPPSTSSNVTARAIQVQPGLTSQISSVLVVQFENHTSHPVTVARYHVEWNGGHTPESQTAFVVPAHGRIERRMHIDASPSTDPSAFRVVFATGR